MTSDLVGVVVCTGYRCTLERGAVHACHAGGGVHFLEGWKHHEVGAIDVDQINVVWHGMNWLPLAQEIYYGLLCTNRTWS
ncbi:hypothetical protein DCAR_0520870 [Daucus carota subsp. sativus]|uniref:Very-long-chain aldehyde decarbonylase CER1-like C-terminal domain-containing protein n=1 Tax=Daucus carota subsp. sativus TaxID=79200 RepID=A0AAF0X7W1_DAUCS|nr:hypothetical protein DCAR_0520870 [Daucus carota subsp. sativus]